METKQLYKIKEWVRKQYERQYFKDYFFIICSITIAQAENNAPAKIVSNCGPDGTNITFVKSNISNIEKLWKSTPQDGGFNYLGFHCDKLEGVKPEAVILKDIDFKTGNYICEYALEQSSSARERKKMAFHKKTFLYKMKIMQDFIETKLV